MMSGKMIQKFPEAQRFVMVYTFLTADMNKRPSIEEDSKGPGGVTASKREFLYR